MKVNSINNISLNSFEGSKNNKKHSNVDYPVNQTDVVSKNGAKSLRNLMYGLMLLGATGLASCETEAWSIAGADADAHAHALALGGGCHHDTITVIKPDTIVDNDTIINTVIEPIYVKDYPFAIGDSLIAQGINIGIPIDGPIPNGSGMDSVVYVGSKAHNRYDNKFYESMVDSVGTNKRELAVVSKVVDMYDFKNPKTSYIKSIITDVPGKGIKITRYVTDSATKPTDREEYLWNYAGYEIRTNGRNGRRNTRSIFDYNNNLIYRGDLQKGEEAGTFLYGSIICDPHTGEPYIDEETGEPEFAQYDFDQAVIYSDYATRSGNFERPGWKQ